MCTVHYLSTVVVQLPLLSRSFLFVYTISRTLRKLWMNFYEIFALRQSNQIEFSMWYALTLTRPPGRGLQGQGQAQQGHARTTIADCKAKAKNLALRPRPKFSIFSIFINGIFRNSPELLTIWHLLNARLSSQRWCRRDVTTRKPCCRKETARYRSCSFRFKVRRQRSLQV